MTALYRKRMIPAEEGLEVWTEKWISIRETECFYMCIKESNLDWIKRVFGDSEIEHEAKARKQLKRIAKRNSRFAFTSEEAALENLKFLKRKQLQHLQRDIRFVKAFLNAETLNASAPGCEVVPDSFDLVHEYFVFN